MYTPTHFAMESLNDQHAHINANAFGILCGRFADDIMATHLPLMLARDEGEYGTLYGHLARANPHVKLLGQEALIIFPGPHAYVSPTWYSDRTTNVPTWNYSSVHCYGAPQEIEGDALAHLGDLVRRYEGGRRNGWSIEELKPQIRQSLPRGIVAFRMTISRIEGKAKLSQNKPAGERLRVIEGLKQDGEHELAAIMQRI